MFYSEVDFITELGKIERLNATDFRDQFTQKIQKACNEGEATLVTRHNNALCVLVPYKTFPSFSTKELDTTSFRKTSLVKKFDALCRGEKIVLSSNGNRLAEVVSYDDYVDSMKQQQINRNVEMSRLLG